MKAKIESTVGRRCCAAGHVAAQQRGPTFLALAEFL
jgi:hypothetical protein